MFDPQFFCKFVKLLFVFVLQCKQRKKNRRCERSALKALLSNKLYSLKTFNAQDHI